MELDQEIRFGAAAVRLGYVTPEQFGEALRRRCDGTEGIPLWHIFTARGWLAPDQVAEITRWADPDGDETSSAWLSQGRYRHEKPLGEGGMGSVRQVFDRSLGRSVAMKRLLPEAVGDSDMAQSLLDEARTAGMLEHPNIIPVYDAGTLPSGEPWYTMRLMDAMSLADVLDLLREGNVEITREYPLSRLLRIFIQICLAVDYAHSRGVVHRDIKPDNIRLGRYGEVQLADWGLARVEGRTDRPLERAMAGARANGDSDPCIVIGSPNYMAPEQAAGFNERVGPHSDIWALGAVLYEILTLEAPYEHADTMILLEEVERAELVPPGERAPDRVIPEPLEALCVAALQKHLDDRVPDVRVMHRAVSDWLEGARNREIADDQAFTYTRAGNRYGDAYLRVRDAYRRMADRLAAPIDDIRRRQLERELSALGLELAMTFSQAYDAYTQAVGFAPDDLVARAKLAELAWNRIEDTEAAGDPTACQFFWNILQRYNDGAWDPLLGGAAVLDVESRPEGATVHLRSYVTPADVGAEDRAVGRTPLHQNDLPAGLYLVTVQLAGHRTEVRPVFLRGGLPRRLRVLLHPTDE